MRSSIRSTVSRTAPSLTILAAALALAVLPAKLNAQSPQQNAVLAFEVYMGRLTSSDVAKENGMSDPAAALGAAGAEGNNGLRPDEIRRFFGSVSAPPSVQSIMAMQENPPEKLDFDFFVRMQYDDAAKAKAAFAEMTKDSEKVTLAGKDCFRAPPEEKAPQNIAAHMCSPDMIEIGTDNYLSLPDRNVFSPNLQAAWPKMPRAGFRLAVDVDGIRSLMDEALQMNGGQVPLPAQPAWQMLGATSTLRLGADLSSDDLLWLTLTGRDAAAADQINGILGGLMAMAKQMGGGALAMAPPKAQAPANELLNALATTRDGNDVNIVLPHPEGLGDAIGDILGAALMGGMQDMPMEGGDFGGDFGGEGFGDATPFGAPEAAPGKAPMDDADPFGGGGDPFGN